MINGHKYFDTIQTPYTLFINTLIFYFLFSSTSLLARLRQLSLLQPPPYFPLSQRRPSLSPHDVVLPSPRCSTPPRRSSLTGVHCTAEFYFHFCRKLQIWCWGGGSNLDSEGREDRPQSDRNREKREQGGR